MTVHLPGRAARPLASVTGILAMLVATLLAPAALAAQGEPEPEETRECCLLLLVPVGARSSALGGTYTTASGPDAVFRNPAGLAGATGTSFLIHHSDISVDTNIEAFTLLFPAFASAFGVTYQLFDKGDIPTRDNTGQPTGELSLRDHLLVASFATELGAGFQAGLNYKYFQQRIDCRGLCGGEESVATTHAADIGVRYVPEWNPALELGASLVNLGLRLQVENAPQADRFPGRLHIGAAYDVLRSVTTDSVFGLRVGVNLEDDLVDPGSPTPSVGVELDMQRAVFLRAGYRRGTGLGTGPAVGVEVRYDRFDIAVSRSFINSSLQADTEPFQVSFGLNF